MAKAPAPTDLSRLIELPIGSLWRRSDIHKLLGGQQQGGISTPAGKPYIILFSSPQGKDYGYKDGWQPDGFYHYTGEGQEGDMTFVRGNGAIRDHVTNSKILLLFDTQKDGRRRYDGPMVYVDYSEEQLPDVKGNLRKGIIFRLTQADISSALPEPSPEAAEALGFLSSRQDALDASRSVTEAVMTSQERRKRSQRVSRYVQERAQGYCEMCGFAAPFSRPDGTPYLESHHFTQLADDGPDAPQDLVAACPTCHRRAHHGTDRKTFNRNAHERIKKVEAALTAGRLKIVTAAFIRDKENQILLAKRKHGQDQGAKWEFPGGKVEGAETLEECLQREIYEEFSVNITEPKRICMVDHTYPAFDIRLCVLEASIQDGTIILHDHDEVAWVRPKGIFSLDLAPADWNVAEKLISKSSVR